MGLRLACQQKSGVSVRPACRAGHSSQVWRRPFRQKGRTEDIAVRTIAAALIALLLAPAALADEPIAPTKSISLFNGKDLTGLATWHKEAKREDPRKVFSVTDGMLHLSGDG